MEKKGKSINKAHLFLWKTEEFVNICGLDLIYVSKVQLTFFGDSVRCSVQSAEPSSLAAFDRLRRADRSNDDHKLFFTQEGDSSD